MAYTGTGTEQDPYLVSTFADFLTCVAIEGAYVKVIADIDASQEEDYIYGIDTAVTVNAAKVCADEVKSISNVAVNGTLYAIQFNNCICENIWFRNWIFRPQSTANTQFFIRLSGSGCALTNVYGSLEYVCANASHGGIITCISFGNYPTVTHCAFNIRYGYAGGETMYLSGVMLNKLIVSRCTFEFTNMLSNSLKLATSTVIDKCTFKGDISYEQQSADTAGSIIDNCACSNVILAIDITRIADSDNTHTNTIGVYGGSSNVIADASLLRSEYVSYSSRISSLTTEQIQDKTYLETIGFLP